MSIAKANHGARVGEGGLAVGVDAEGVDGREGGLEQLREVEAADDVVEDGPVGLGGEEGRAVGRRRDRGERLHEGHRDLVRQRGRLRRGREHRDAAAEEGDEGVDAADARELRRGERRARDRRVEELRRRQEERRVRRAEEVGDLRAVGVDGGDDLEEHRVARVLERLERVGAARVEDGLRLEHQRDVVRVGAAAVARVRRDELVGPLHALERLARRRLGVLVGVVPRGQPVVGAAERRLGLLGRQGGVLRRREAERGERLLARHRRRHLLELRPPRGEDRLQERHRLVDGPLGEALLVAEVAQVVPVAEELLLELGVHDARQRAVVVERHAVVLQRDGQVAHVQREPLDHVAAHLVVPDVLGRVEVAEEDLRELVGAVALEAAHHRLRQRERQVGAAREAAGGAASASLPPPPPPPPPPSSASR